MAARKKPKQGREDTPSTNGHASNGRIVRRGVGAAPDDDQADDQQGAAELYDRPAAEIRAAAPHWLWPGRLQFGTVAILQGEKGAGKSTWARTIAAHVSGGPRLPDAPGGRRKPAAVLYYSGEESLASRVQPGLAAAGARLDYVYLADTSGNAGQQLQLPTDCRRLQRRIETLGAALVVIDPIFCFSDGMCELEGPTMPARMFMKALAAVAESTACVILLTRNLTKARHNGALASGRGSAEIGNAARSVLHAARIPSTLDYALAVAACNAGEPVPAVRYQLVNQGGAGAVSVLGTADVTADELATGEEGLLERSDVERATALIRSLIPDGRLDSKVVKQKAENAMISLRTLQAAAHRIGVRHQREGSREATVVYWLPPRGGWPK